MAANPTATALVAAAEEADTAITALRAALDAIRTNEENLRKQLGRNANVFIMGRRGLAEIAAGRVLGTAPDNRNVAEIATAAWSDQLA